MSTPQNEFYLGDGLYVSFDGFQFRLRAPRSDGDHSVYLDSETFQLFKQYVEQRIGGDDENPVSDD